MQDHERVNQVALARVLDALGVVWCHPPNGGKRHASVGAKLKAEGAKAGVPDVLIFGPDWVLPEGCRGLAIELKRPRSATGRALGRTSPAQKQWLADLESCGWQCTVAHGLVEALQFLRDNGVIA